MSRFVCGASTSMQHSLWSCSELVCCVAGQLDARSLLALRSVSQFHVQLLSNDEPLFEAAFRRTFRYHGEIGLLDRGLLSLGMRCGWRGRCARRLYVEATHEAAGIGIDDLVDDWPLTVERPRIEAETVAGGTERSVLAEAVLHQLESDSLCLAGYRTVKPLYKVLCWAARAEHYEVVLQCLQRIITYPEPDENEHFVLFDSLHTELREALASSRPERFVRLLLVFYQSVPGALALRMGAATSASPWFWHAAKAAAGSSTDRVTDIGVWRSVLFLRLASEQDWRNLLEDACRNGRTEIVRWLLTDLPSLFENVEGLLRATYTAFCGGERSADVVALLWSTHVSRVPLHVRASKLALDIERIHPDLALSFLVVVGQVHESWPVGLAFRRFLCRARDAHCDSVRAAVRSVGYRCSAADWEIVKDFAALHGQPALLDVCIKLSPETPCYDVDRDARLVIPCDVLGRRVAAAMCVDERRVKLCSWASFGRRLPRVVWLNLLHVLERTGCGSSEKELDDALRVMFVILIENREVGEQVEGSDCPDDHDQFVQWTCASRRNELVLALLLRDPMRSPSKSGGWRMRRIFENVLCASPTADAARDWLLHPSADSLLAERTRDNLSTAGDPACYNRIVWARRICRIARDDVFTALLSDERVVRGHVDCAVLRELLMQDNDDHTSRLRTLLQQSRRLAFLCCDSELERLDATLLYVVRSGRVGPLRLLLDDGRFDFSVRNNAALRMAVWLERPGQPQSLVRTMLENDPRVQDRARKLRLFE
ncbi:Hypothetical protein UVM_LOCUS174 [uncultured virus]|nr:Hypothetical protein UVM_LOCUS174 [uncultured virus]